MPDLLCLGEPLIEFNQQPDGQYLSCFGGDISNVAIAAARQGAQSGILSRIGADRFADDLRTLWKHESVGDEYVIKTPDKDTGLYFVHHDPAGHHFTYRRKGSAASCYAPEDLPIEALETCKIFYASGISLAISRSSRTAVVEAARLAKSNNHLFAFDPNLRTALWSLEEARSVTHEVMAHCDIALPGYEDACQLTGLDRPEDITKFYHTLGASVVALTLGKKGVLLSCDGQQQMIAPHCVPTVDATGAGDCFNGAFLAAFLAGVGYLECAMRANMAAALSTTDYGAIAGIPTLSQSLDALVRQESRASDI